MREIERTGVATSIVELTPPGRGAVAVVLVTGLDAVAIVDQCFHPADGRRLADAQINRIRLGRWMEPDGEELIACRRSDSTVEVHCHGGAAAIRAVVDALAEQGGRPTSWQDWIGGMETDPIRAHAAIALADAPTARTAAVLLDQFHGALAAAVQSVLGAASAGNWPAAVESLDAVLRGDFGRHLTTPWRVVLAGPPNVGKSSLMNALVGFQRAIVCELAGTTRDVVTATTAIDGWPIQLADTAGLGDTHDALESAGVALALAAAAEADLVVVVEDCTDPSTLPAATNAKRILRVLNKIDLLPASTESEISAKWDVQTSAFTVQGIDALVSAIGQTLVPLPPPAGAAVPFTADQLAQLTAARAAVDARDAVAVAACLQPLLAR